MERGQGVKWSCPVCSGPGNSGCGLSGFLKERDQGDQVAYVVLSPELLQLVSVMADFSEIL